jgi:hypothetical protein
MGSASNTFVLGLYRAARRLPPAQLRTFVFEGLASLVQFDGPSSFSVESNNHNAW